MNQSNDTTPRDSSIAAAGVPPKQLTDYEYQTLLNLFNEFNEDFWCIREETKNAFFARLYRKD